MLKLPNWIGWKFISSLDKITLVPTPYKGIINQPKINENIHLTGKTMELITIVK